MKISRIAIVGAATALVAGAEIAPSAAFADSSMSWSVSTICPGETVTLTANGISDGQLVVLTPPEYFREQIGSFPQDLNNSLTTGEFSWAQLASFQGMTYVIEVITGGDLSDPSVGTVLSTSSLQILSESECSSPAPEAEALPDTGASAGTMTALALGAAVLGLGGAVLARRARRVASSK
jgi:LPXTG-motif cell wall-anchored protein